MLLGCPDLACICKDMGAHSEEHFPAAKVQYLTGLILCLLHAAMALVQPQLQLATGSTAFSDPLEGVSVPITAAPEPLLSTPAAVEARSSGRQREQSATPQRSAGPQLPARPAKRRKTAAAPKQAAAEGSGELALVP